MTNLTFRTAVLSLFAGSILSLAVSCKKDKEIVTIQPLQSAPISSALFLNGFYTITTPGAGSYEYGTVFQVTKNGKITRLACKMPTAGSYRVTLWDTAANPKTPLAQATITQPGNGVLTYGTITPVAVTTTGTYLVSIWSNTNWFDIRPVGAGSIPYPITSGDVVLKSYRWVGTPQSPIKYPTNVDNSYIAGMADVEFQAN